MRIIWCHFLAIIIALCLTEKGKTETIDPKPVPLRYNRPVYGGGPISKPPPNPVPLPAPRPIPSPRPKPPILTIQPPVIRPGQSCRSQGKSSRFRVNCNWCFCSKKGKALCTKRECTPKFMKCFRNTPFCYGKISWIARGKLCYCRGMRPVCYSKPTPPPKNCEAFSSNAKWLQSCNWCRCSRGRSVCTKRGCGSNFKPPPIQCFGKVRWKTGGTWYKCLKGLPVRETKPSPVCNTNLQKNCNYTGKRSDWFMIGCSKCWCGKDGQADCVKRRCPPGYTPPAKVCHGKNTSWKIGCNWCSCTSTGVPRCTRRACPDKSRCPENRALAYMLLKGCKPVYRGGGVCATHFKCPKKFDPRVPKGKCSYGGVLYDERDPIPSNNPCLKLACSRSRIIKAVVDCFRPFPPKDRKDCWLASKIDQCCSSYKCGKANAHKCNWRGETYYEGQRIPFSGGEADRPYACQTCVCAKNFSGPYGPSCKKLDCTYELSSNKDRIRKGCVPLFFRERCCPIDYICPGDKEIAGEQPDANPKGCERDVCKFGKFTVEIGRQLATKNPKINCKCVTPPDVTCERT